MSRYSKKITAMKEPLNFDLQLAAAEIDTSVPRMRYISNTVMEDAFSIEAFDSFWKALSEIPEITSLDDNTVMKEYEDEAIIIHETLNDKYVIYDSMCVQKMEALFDSYRERN